MCIYSSLVVIFIHGYIIAQIIIIQCIGQELDVLPKSFDIFVHFVSNLFFSRVTTRPDVAVRNIKLN